MLGIKQQIINVIKTGHIAGAGCLQPIQQLRRGLQPANDQCVSPGQQRLVFGGAKVVFQDDATLPAEGFELLLFLQHPKLKALGQVIAGEQQPAPDRSLLRAPIDVRSLVKPAALNHLLQQV